METINRLTTEMLYTNPLLLLAIKDKQVIQQLNELIPYSTAFEIECDMIGIDHEHTDYKTINLIINKHNEIFKSIPDIVAVENDSGEQRYRIPNGLKGSICLYNICRHLRTNSLLNPLSGIHYHVDCTDCFKEINTLVHKNQDNINYILSELDTWLEEGESYDNGSRYIGSWFKLNDLETIEFRMGEMTFDYRLILKRIIHCNNMVKKFKDQIPTAKQPEYVQPDVKILTAYNRTVFSNTLRLQMEIDKRTAALTKLQEKEVESSSIEEFRKLKQSRLHNINPNQQL